MTNQDRAPWPGAQLPRIRLALYPGEKPPSDKRGFVPYEPEDPDSPESVAGLRIRLRAAEGRIARLEANERARAEAAVLAMTPFEAAVIEMQDRVRLLSAQVAALRLGAGT